MRYNTMRTLFTAIPRLATIAVCTLPLFAQSRDELMHFYASCDVVTATYVGRDIPCRLDDEASTGYYNKWSITLYGNLPIVPIALTDMVREGLTPNGTLLHMAVLWGTLDVRPLRRDIAEYFTHAWEHDPGNSYEVRPQHWTVTHGDNETRITIAEPVTDSTPDGGITRRWVHQWLDSVRQWSRAKHNTSPN